MGIVLSGSLNVTGSLLVNGTAVSTGSGGSAGFNPITNFYSLVNNREANVVQTLDVSAGGTFNLHISASGLHKITTPTLASATTASINLYFYPDSFATESQAAVYAVFNSGSGNNQYRTIISSSVGTYFTPSATPGTTTLAVTKGTSRVNTQIGQGNAGAPQIFTVFSDGSKVFGFSSIPMGANNFEFSGNQGTPLA